MTKLPTITPGPVLARPLAELVSLIRRELRDGAEAAREAGLPYYTEAGAKLLEAKSQIKRGEFRPWVKRNFKISDRTCSYYMKLAREAAREMENGNALPFSS